MDGHGLDPVAVDFQKTVTGHNKAAARLSGDTLPLEIVTTVGFA